MTNEKLTKNISQWDFDFSLFTNLLLVTFLRVHSNSKEVSYLSWQNTYPNLKTTCHIKLNFFLWTKLLEHLLHAKYQISVTAPLAALYNKIASVYISYRHTKIELSSFKGSSKFKRLSFRWCWYYDCLYRSWSYM